MRTYKAACKLTDGVFLGEALDFPGTVSFGHTLEEARRNLAGALFDMAETNLSGSEPLPVPDPKVADPDADLEEPIYLAIQTGQQLSVNVASDGPQNGVICFVACWRKDSSFCEPWERTFWRLR